MTAIEKRADMPSFRYQIIGQCLRFVIKPNLEANRD